MAYTDATSSHVQTSGEIVSTISGTIGHIFSTRNVQFQTSVFRDRQVDIETRSLGNYKNAYEFVSISGRRENNLFLRDNPTTQSLPNNPFLVGTVGYQMISRSFNKSVVAVKFSAPGGREIQSRGNLDRESEEFSAYNSMNFRNFAVRSASNDDAALHTDLSLTASYTKHKINRNPRYSVMQNGTDIGIPSRLFITSSNFDNGFVSFHIPYHPDQIQWAYRVFAKTSGSWAVRFAADPDMTGSDLFFTASVSNSGSLTASLTNDYAPSYGFPSWVQVRAGQSWKNRVVKNNNYFIRFQRDINNDNSTIVQPKLLIDSGSFDTSSEGQYLFKESPVDFTNESIEFIVPLSHNLSRTLKEGVFHNVFFNDELNNAYGLIDTSKNHLSIDLSQYSGTYIKRSKKQIFPNPKHAGLKRTRTRPNFSFDAWLHDEYRFRPEVGTDPLGYHFNILGIRMVSSTMNGYVNKLVKDTGSIWPLDYFGHPRQQLNEFVAGELMLKATPAAPTVYASYVANSLSAFGVGGYVPWTAFSQANSVPYSEEFIIPTKYSQFSSIPEFNVSSNINSATFSVLDETLSQNLLSLYHTGATLNAMFTDDVTIKDNLEFSINSVLKVRPYKNFYPCQFSLECASLLSASLKSISTLLPIDSAMEPFFNPGIIYNSIKAGLPMGLVSPSASFESILDAAQFIKQKRFGSVNLTQSFSTEQFQNATNNFLDEIRHSFCKNSDLEYFRSKAEKEFNIFTAGTKYSMDIHLTPGQVDITGSTNGITTLQSNIGGINYLYADPYDLNLAPWWRNANSIQLVDESSYLCGNAVLRIEFTPTLTRYYTIDEIFALSTKEIRRSPLSRKFEDSIPSITGSFNVFEKKLVGDDSYWTIKSKWEFPFLAMTGAIMSFWDNSNLDGFGAGAGVYPARPHQLSNLQYFGGLWHDFCDVPTAKQGLFLHLNNVDFYSGSSHIISASLAQQVGFLPSKKRVSELKSQLRISELLCIIPIKKSDNSMFEIDASYETYQANEKMAKKFFIPPLLGYKDEESTKASLFFCSQIDDTWSKRDLAFIWQNLLPQNGLKHKEKKSSIKVSDQKVLSMLKDQDVYFIVLKCKVRSVSNPWPMNGYNWPYDYFSLIELAKIDISSEEIFNP